MTVEVAISLFQTTRKSTLTLETLAIGPRVPQLGHRLQLVTRRQFLLLSQVLESDASFLISKDKERALFCLNDGRCACLVVARYMARDKAWTDNSERVKRSGSGFWLNDISFSVADRSQDHDVEQLIAELFVEECKDVCNELSDVGCRPVGGPSSRESCSSGPVVTRTRPMISSASETRFGAMPRVFATGTSTSSSFSMSDLSFFDLLVLFVVDFLLFLERIRNRNIGKIC